MKYQFAAVIGAGAIAAFGLVGCSGDKGENTSTGDGGTAAANATAKVVVDGKEQKVEGAIACSPAAGQFNIGIGSGETAVAAVLTDGDSPKVTSVGLGNIDGVTLGYADGAPGGKASATKDGKRYTITGTATGVDIANPMQGPVAKQFEIEVTCP